MLPKIPKRLFLIIFFSISCKFIFADGQKPKPLVKALKINYPYKFFVEDSPNWKDCKNVNHDLMTHKDYIKWSHAQDHEDIWLYENWFYGVEKGVILESGAFDGVTYSNSYMFEVFAHWTPIHVEADPRNFFKLVRSRPESINIHAALCSESKLLHYTNDKGGQIQGFVEFMPEKFLKMWHPALYKDRSLIQTLPTVQCVRVKKLLQEINVQRIDVWILDIEGAELSALHGTDFASVRISTIVMECDGKDETKDVDKTNFLKGHGYTCQLVERNCFCKHHSFIPSTAPASDRFYDNMRINKKTQQKGMLVEAWQ